MKEKWCNGCKSSKPVGEFHSHKAKKDGLSTQCKVCVNARNKAWYKKNKAHADKRSKAYYKANLDQFRNQYLKDKYGIDLETYRAMQEAQNHVCAICGKPETAKDGRSGKVRELAVDHCHETLVVRGLLCYQCNHILGRMGDNIEGVMRYVTYLEGGGAL